MDAAPLRVLLVEDNPADAHLVHECLGEAPATRYEIDHASTLQQARQRLDASTPDVVLLDLTLPDSSAQGLDTFRAVRAWKAELPIVVLSGLEDEKMALQAVREGAQDYLVKSDLNGSMLTRVLRYAVERTRMEHSMAARERRFRALIEHSHDAKLLMDPSGTVLYASPAAERMMGYAAQGWEDAHALRQVHPDDLLRLTECFEAVKRTPGATESLVLRAMHRDGEWRWLDGTMTNLLHDRAVGAVVVNYRDVTKQVQAHEALMDSERRYRKLFEHSLDGVAHTAPDGSIFEMNPALLDMLGYTKAEAKKRRVRREDIVDTNDPRFAAAVEEQRHTGSFRGELTFRRKDGTLFPAEITTSIYLAPNGQERSSMIVRDVSEQRRHEQRTRDYQVQLERSEKISLVMIAHTSLDGRWLMVPPRLCDLLGYSEQELLGMRYQDVSHPDEIVAAENVDQQLIEGRADSLEMEKRYVRKDGGIVWAYLNASIVKDGDDRPLHVRTYIRDITAERAAEERALHNYDLLLRRITGLAERVSLAKGHAAIYRAVFDFARDSTPADSIFVAHFNPETGLRRCVFAAGLADGYYEEDDVAALPLMPLNDGPQGQAIRERKTIVIPDLRPVLSSLPAVDLGSDSETNPARSSIAVPMLIENEIIGAFELQSTQPEAFGPEHVSALRMAANLAAIATQNLELLQRQRSARKQAEAERSRLQEVLEQAPALMARVEGPEHVFTYANEKYIDFFGGRDIVGRSMIEVMPEIEEQGIVRILDCVYETGESFTSNEMTMKLDPSGSGLLEHHYFDLVYQRLYNPEGNIFGVLMNAVNITEQVSARKEAEALHEELEAAYDRTIEGWGRALDLKDEETAGHSQRVTDMTVALARHVGMSEEDLVHVRRGALLHDIGKMGIPDAILLKPGKLTPAEWEVMRGHTVIGRDLLAPVEFLRPAIDIPYCHHEKWDGSGYPQGLKGAEIPLAARLFAVVDVFDALTSDRPYRSAWPVERTLNHIGEQAGTHFDPGIMAAFMDLMGGATAGEEEVAATDHRYGP